jgi:predicted GNAT family N-acyltransferase
MAEPDKPARKLEDFTLAEPRTAQEWEHYFDLRWRVLREPWGQPRGSERDDFDAESFHLMLRDSSGAVVAVGRLHLNSPSEAQVRYMAVDEGLRGRGLGGQILSGLEDHARAQRVTAMVLNARDSAINFYRRRGYAVEGPGDILFGEVRHFRMRKELGP